MMTKSGLKKLFEQELLIEAVIESSMIEDVWIVEFRHADGNLIPLTDGKGTERIFNDVESASMHALDIGFYQVRIVDEY